MCIPFASAHVAAAIHMTRSLQIQGRQPRHENIRAEDDHATVRDDHAAFGKHADNPARHEEKETSSE